MASNVPPGKEAEPAQTSSTNSQNKNETVNYEISRTVSKIVEPTGTIKRLSAAVLVDGKYEGGKADGGHHRRPAATTAGPTWCSATSAPRARRARWRR